LAGLRVPAKTRFSTRSNKLNMIELMKSKDAKRRADEAEFNEFIKQSSNETTDRE